MEEFASSECLVFKAGNVEIKDRLQKDPGRLLTLPCSLPLQTAFRSPLAKNRTPCYRR